MARTNVKSGRKIAKFAYVGSPADKEYEGWTNSATWCFSLYFFQERNNVERFKRVIVVQNGKEVVPLGVAKNLFDHAQRHGEMEQIDDDCEGFVNVREIVDFQLAERERN